MNERPIIFSPTMVQAILRGQKTQTRRVVKPQPPGGHICVMPLSTEVVGVTRHGGPLDRRGWLTCPYGVPGDRLWVRETWGLYNIVPSDGPDNAHVFYKATDGNRHDLRYQLWRPSIHMPRWACRLTLRVESVRVERLRDIVGEDVHAEGFGDIREMRDLWNKLHDRDGFDWEANPWVWVVTFRPDPAPSSASSASPR